jgi:predicted porin
LAAATGAFAQSSVELYGIIDQSVSSLTGKFTDADGSTKVTSSTTGNQSGLATQRLGFRGTEDLGGGLKAKFQIESSLSAGNSSANTIGSRPTFVGLEGAFGTVLLGRQDTPLLKAVVPQLAGGANNVAGQIMWSPLNTSLVAGASAGADQGFGRIARETTIDRAINYLTPNFSGVTAEFQYGQSNVKTSTTGLATGTDKAEDIGMNVKYANGPLTANFGTHTQKLAKDSTVSNDEGKNANNYVGATYDLGVANLSLQYGTSKRTNVTSAQVYKNSGLQFGAQVPVSASLGLFASIGTGKRTFGVAADNDKFKQTSFQLGAAYSLSKRTKFYTVYGASQLKGDTTETTGQKWKESQLAFGVNHAF